MYRFQQKMYAIRNSFSNVESLEFVQGIADNNDHKLIVQAIISMAKSLKKELVAEGVETAEQARYLQECNCNVVQGYLFSKPKPFAEIDMQASWKDAI